MSHIQKYFTNRAKHYQQSTKSLVWGWQRRRESQIVLNFLGDIVGKEVLELGCGAGFYTRLLIESGARHITAVDFSQKMIDQLPKNQITAICGDAMDVKFNRQFNKIVSAGLLEFVPFPNHVLSNARKLATDDGLMVCLIPPDNFAGKLYRQFHLRHGFKINLFSQESFSKMANKNGWEVVSKTLIFPNALVVSMKALKVR